MSNAQVNAQYADEFYGALIAKRDTEILLLRTQIGALLNKIDTMQIIGLPTAREQLASINYNAAVRAVKRAAEES